MFSKNDFEKAKSILNLIVMGSSEAKERFVENSLYSSNELKDDEKISVFRLCAISELSETISVNLGGMVFDELEFVFFAAENLKKNQKVLPIAKNYQEYQTLKKSLNENKFAKAISLFNGNDLIDCVNAQNPFDVIEITGKNLKMLRENGCCSFKHGDCLKFFELYNNPDF